MVGSYAPKLEMQSYSTPVDEMPSGFVARGNYTVKSLFTDDDKNEHLKWEWCFELKKDWEWYFVYFLYRFLRLSFYKCYCFCYRKVNFLLLNFKVTVAEYQKFCMSLNQNLKLFNLLLSSSQFFKYGVSLVFFLDFKYAD